MPAGRYFIREPLKLDTQITLIGTEHHHLCHVMRAKKKDVVEVINGEGALAEAIVQEVSKDRAILLIKAVTIEAGKLTRVVLVQGMPRPNKLDFVLEKGIELGMDELWLFPAGNSVKASLTASHMQRMEHQMIAAMKQCGRLFLPKIVWLTSLSEQLPVEGIAFFGDLSPNAPALYSILPQASSSRSIFFITGPEGGLTREEIKTLKEKGAYGVKLASHVLRTETASLMALGLIEHWLMMHPN